MISWILSWIMWILSTRSWIVSKTSCYIESAVFCSSLCYANSSWHNPSWMTNTVIGSSLPDTEIFVNMSMVTNKIHYYNVMQFRCLDIRLGSHEWNAWKAQVLRKQAWQRHGPILVRTSVFGSGLHWVAECGGVVSWWGSITEWTTKHCWLNTAWCLGHYPWSCG